jgi:hypothetical protein
MAFFGKKKEQPKAAPVKDLPKHDLELKEEESHFTSPEDLMKMTTEQLNPNYTQPQMPVQNMPVVQPVTQLPQPRAQPSQPRMQPSQFALQPAVQAAVEPEKQTSAPLFVKLERYRNILKTLGEIKTTLAITKNAFKMFEQIDKIEDDNMNLIRAAIENIEAKLTSLDSEFMRPSGFEEETAETEEFDNVQTVLSDLQVQIEQLRGHMEQVQ